ncbi:MAG TPA: ABC transporter substrate-binding protein [Candidatus Cloacimonadota bacterium]|nr:ABC transporter substrate-binding protein [Candidatus Cloacimonadota bacterium]HQB41145.1 ABC transporter substrate-binding protein [Candidatus Cloacimonadota bacterium]
MSRSELFTGLVNDQIYASLFTTKGDDYTGNIAKNWTNENDSTLVININDNIYFHNGDPITIEDVKASFERFNSSKKSIFYNPDRTLDFIVRDKYTIEIRYLKESYSPMFLLFTPIYSAKQIDLFDEGFDPSHIISSGRYYIYSYNDSLIVLRENKYFKEKDSDLFKEIQIFKIEDKNRQADMLINGELDFVMNPSIERMEQITNELNLFVSSEQSNQTMYMMLNINSEHLHENPNMPNPLSDKRVRQAIWHAIDLKSFVETKLLGYGEQLTFPWPSFLNGANMTLKPPQYDIKKSKDLLKQAGYENGFDLDVYCIEKKYNGDEEVGKLIKSSLDLIGINVELKLMKSENLFRFIEKNPISTFIAGYNSNATDIEDVARALTYKSPSGRYGILNRLSIDIPELSTLMTDAMHLPIDAQERTEKMQLISEYIHNEAVIIPLYSPSMNYAYSRKVKLTTLIQGFDLSSIKRK